MNVQTAPLLNELRELNEGAKQEAGLRERFRHVLHLRWEAVTSLVGRLRTPSPRAPTVRARL